MIDHNRKLILIHITRCGGTSIEHALVGNDWAKIDSATKHISCSQARARYREKWDEYTTFTVVRNPFDRAVSMWLWGGWVSMDALEVKRWRQIRCLVERENVKDLVAIRQDFTKFLRKIRPQAQEKYASLNYPDILNLPVDYVLRFERLKEDFAGLVPDAKLPHIGRTENKSYLIYYDAESIKLASELFRPSLEWYDYEFREVA